MAEARRKFDQDFREGAVRLVRETGHPIAQIAKDLGINPGTLANWVALDRRAKDGNGRLSEDERIELARLRRENAELAMERDVLKRSVALWVKDATGRRWACPGSSPPRGPNTGYRTRWRPGRWGSRRPGSTNGATATPRPGEPDGG